MGTGVIPRAGQMGAQPGMPGGAMFPQPASPFLGILPRWMWPVEKRVWMLPFTAITNLAAAGATTATATIDVGKYYVAYYGNAVVRANAAGKAIQSDFPATVSFATQNNELFNPAGTSMDFNNVFGSAKQPSVWALPMILKPGDILVATVVNNHNATAVDVAMLLMGFLVDASGKQQ